MLDMNSESVLVQREMESWRAPLVTIAPIPPGQFAPLKTVAAGGRGSDGNCNWFQKGHQVGWSHSPQGALDTGKPTGYEKNIDIRAGKHVNKQACRGIRPVPFVSAGGCQWKPPCFSFRLAEVYRPML
jgi:hypothetical protein